MSRAEKIAALVARYRGADAAFFLMEYPARGVRWPPPADERAAVLARCVLDLTVTFVNEHYRTIYSVRGSEPEGWNLARLVGSPVTAAQLLRQFYSSGGHTHGTMFRPRYDGHLMAVKGEYHIIEVDGEIVGHYGVEEDITAGLANGVAES